MQVGGCFRFSTKENNTRGCDCHLIIKAVCFQLNTHINKTDIRNIKNPQKHTRTFELNHKSGYKSDHGFKYLFAVSLPTHIIDEPSAQTDFVTSGTGNIRPGYPPRLIFLTGKM